MILCAAIKVTFQRNSEPVTAVIPGYRHGNVWELMSTLGLPPKSEREDVEGFIDHQGTFLDRREAFEHARMCGQLSDTTLTYKQEKGEGELYSEDLY